MISHTVPHLAIKNVQGLEHLENTVLANQIKIEQWFRQSWGATPPPFYSSVDLRNAGFKLAPVDTNLFPAGFNNLNVDFDSLCVQAVQSTLQHYHVSCMRVLLIPENHSRNVRYFENIARLIKIFRLAGYDIRCGTLREDITSAETINLDNGDAVILEPVIRKGNRISVADDFCPCLILLNNDFSEGAPEILLGLEQTLVPSLALSWKTRRKSTHFEFYNQVAQDFSALIGIDDWLVNSYFDVAKDMDFLHGTGAELLADKASHIFEKIRRKYQEYNIQEEPYLIVKADAGTYGMGIIHVKDPKELLTLNRKQRTKMSTSKGNQPITEVLLQEGVPSFEEVGEPPATAEPVVYMIAQHVVGGFYRVHPERGPHGILNAPGMHFEPLAFDRPCLPDLSCSDTGKPNRFYMYGVVARLAALAAGFEAVGVSL